MTRDDSTTRRMTSSLAGILRELELRQPRVVTGRLLNDVIAETGSHLSKKDAAERLVREGWLSPLRTGGAWEYVPASRAGRYPSGDPWIELRALLALKPDVPVAVAFGSAVWESGFSSHQPTRHTIAHRHGWRPPRSLGDLARVTFEWRLPAGDKNGLPIWHPATIVVAAAARPGSQGNWGNAEDWLPEALQAASPSDVVAEANGRGTATLARLSYLAEWSGRSDISDAVEPLLPDELPVTYLGPRESRGRWIKRWRLYDSLLPSR